MNFRFIASGQNHIKKIFTKVCEIVRYSTFREIHLIENFPIMIQSKSIFSVGLRISDKLSEDRLN